MSEQQNPNYQNQQEAKVPSKTHSILRQALFVGFIGMLLMIPLLMVGSLASSRKSDSQAVMNDITSKWGGEQSVTTPVLAIPFASQQDTTEWSYVFVLPRDINASASLAIEERHRSIYKVPVYTAKVHMEGDWQMDDIRQMMKDKPGRYNFSQAKVALAVSDAVGLRQLIYVKVGNDSIRLKSDDKIHIGSFINENDVVDIAYTDAEYAFTDNVQSAFCPISPADSSTVIPFSCEMTVLGSQKFGFLPIGMNSSARIEGNWGDPSFQGMSLPVSSNITEEKFEAEWTNASADNFVEAENFPMIGKRGSHVDFISTVNNYTKTDRSIKYGILVIGLTLLSIFLIELTLRKRGKSINAFHYLLTGLSLVLFYSLLLSFSEVLGFGWAYLIASVMTIVLNTLYFKSVLREQKTAILLGGILAFLYISVYLLLIMDNYALLVGSLWLFAILAFIMFYSAKVLRVDKE